MGAAAGTLGELLDRLARQRGQWCQDAWEIVRHLNERSRSARIDRIEQTPDRLTIYCVNRPFPVHVTRNAYSAYGAARREPE